MEALGFRIGDVAYTPDINGIPEREPCDALERARSVDRRRVALRCRIRAISACAETLAWIERLKPKRAVLTNMHIDLDYGTLKAELPPYSRARI